ncbi:MAG: CARDB domain-containing protein [Candidatus Bathyarchaeia archaeon]
MFYLIATSRYIKALLIICGLIMSLYPLSFRTEAAVDGTSKLEATIVETLISIDDPEFDVYNYETGNGTVAKVYDRGGVKYFESLINGSTAPHPPDDYEFRYLTGIPVVDTSKHWNLYFKHRVVNRGNVTIENCRLDGWHAYIIAPDGNLWRLYKYSTQTPETLRPGEQLIATNTYQIHNIPNYRATFYFTFNSGDSILDSWEIGREILRFVGSNYSLPHMNLLRLKPGKVELTPPTIIDYIFNITNLRDDPLRISVEYKFAETVVWTLHLWPSGYMGKIGKHEVTLKPMGTWSTRMTETFPDDKSDHAVHIYYGVTITSGEDAPPLKGEIWEDLYGVNSYLGLKDAYTRLIKSGRFEVEVAFTLVPYVSPSSQDVKPYEYNITLTIYDSDYKEVIYGPLRRTLTQQIRKGHELDVYWRIPTGALNNREGKYMAQIDTWRLPTGRHGPMHLARISLPFWLTLPDIAVKPEDIKTQKAPEIGVENRLLIELFNRGRMDAENFPIEVYVDGAPLQSRNISVPAGASIVEDFTWTPQKKTQTIMIKVDPKGLMEEADKTNNVAERPFTVGQVMGEAYVDTYSAPPLIITVILIVTVTVWLMRRAIHKRRSGSGNFGLGGVDEGEGK